MREKIYARSIIKRLQKEVGEASTSVLVFSPFLTSTTADIVVGAAREVKPEVYTVFSARNFVFGASSLVTLDRLLEMRAALYHLSNLHAKVVITDEFASVGSQNLTQGGTRNREVSMATTSEREIAYLRQEVMKWIDRRIEITPEMIEDLRREIPVLQKQFKQFDKKMQTAEERVFNSQKTRDAERELERRRQARQKALRKLAPPSQTITCRLTTRDIYEDGWPERSYHTLIASSPEESLLRWSNRGANGDSELVEFSKRDRCLMILLDNGRLGWPALNKTRLTKFGIALDTEMQWGDGQDQFPVRIEFPARLDDVSDWNVCVSIWPSGSRHPETAPVKVYGHFYLDGLDVTKIDRDLDGRHWDERMEEIALGAEDPGSEVNKKLIRKIIEPFRYEYNSEGIYADEFFDGCGWSFNVTLREIEGHKILTAESI